MQAVGCFNECCMYDYDKRLMDILHALFIVLEYVFVPSSV